METRRRSVVKAIIWNVVGLLVMLSVGFAATGSFALGGAMALVNAGLGFACYLIYERVWAAISWGRHA